ncbi:MAG TPA: FHA domain-containing protein [Candidatus Acidoferrum sp.]|nr:FHA domain-containing protein [Candidatus Acidoferrum sp.]
MPKLIFTSSALARDGYELILEKTTVGRSDGNTLVVHDPSLSATHCEILLNGSEVIVRDLDSRNGTFVNGVRLQNGQAQLKHGQAVRFGSVEARLELDDEDEDTATDVTAIHAFGKAIRDQRREALHPKPTDASQHIGQEQANGGDEKTSTMPIAPQRASPSPAPVGVPSQSKPPAGRSTFVWTATVLIVICAIVLLWKLLPRS